MGGRIPNPTAFNGDRVNQLGSRSSLRLYRHLPEELLLEILCRLPVKSLLRFRCVSKPWLALVDDDADFARLHLHTFKKNRDQSRLLVVKGGLRNFAVRCADTFESICKISFNSQEAWDIVSSVDGLVLLEAYNNVLDCVLKLWNPSLRQIREVPGASLHPYKRSQVIGLGYDLLAKDYKIVTLINSSSLVGMYTVGADSWRIIGGLELGLKLRGGVYLQGILYFLTMDDHNLVRLTTFDLSKEVFSRTIMPDDYNNPSEINLELFLVDGGSSVAVYNKSDYSSIWVLEKDMNWTKIRLWRRETTGPLYSKKKGDRLICSYNVWRDGQVESYSYENHKFKILQRKTWIGDVFSYVESLIFNKLNRV